MTDTQTDTTTHEIRASAHAAAPAVLRAAQLFRDGVNDHYVAMVFYGLEQGVKLYRNKAGRWRAPTGTMLAGTVHWMLSTAVNEMIRTGLLRHVEYRHGAVTTDYLIPARVHLKDPADSTVSACRFVGEDLGPMRSRLVDDLSLVDCLECEDAVARGGPRGL
jgi:hypothetical protein